MEWNGGTALRSMKDIDPKSLMNMATILDIDPVSVASGSSEKGNPAQEEKPRKKTMTSVYLKYFETAPDGKSRKCKFCGQTYSIATAIGNLGRHLGTRHPGYDNFGEPVTSSPPPPCTFVLKKHQPEVKTPKKMNLVHLNWLIVKWITSSSLPPEIIEETWLLNSFKFLSHSAQIWPTEEFHTILHEIYMSMQKDIGKTLDQLSSKVAVALEFWTTYEQISYMSITCHWIDDIWTFQKVLLDICRIPYPREGAEIYHALVRVLKLYKIDDKVIACTHDNSQMAMYACHKLKEDMDDHKMGPFFYIPCAALTLNMIIENGLRTTKPIISKVREFVIEMNASSAIIEDFIQLTTANQEGIWKFPLDTSARWNGHYLMMDIVRKASKSMDGVIRKYDDILGTKMLLSSSERKAVDIMHGYRELFYKTTNNICSSNFPTLGLVLFFMDHISEISSCKDSHHHPEWLKTASEDMALKAMSYNNQLCNTFTYMTAILDPRIKGELLPDGLNSENNLEEASRHFLGNYSSAPHLSPATNKYGIESEDGEGVSFAEEIARKKRRASMSVPTDELSMYLSEPPAPISTDVLEWWKANCARFPRLSVMARDFLSVQPTSVAPEEEFSSKGDEIKKVRFGLPSTSTRVLLCVRSWNEGGFRLKYESWAIDYDRLMEMVDEAAGDYSKTGSDKKHSWTASKLETLCWNSKM